MEKISVDEILEAVEGTIINNGQLNVTDIYINKIMIDSRSDFKNFNTLFIPLVGENQDGHTYINKAFENGAIITLTSKSIEELVDINKDYMYIKVKDTKEALFLLASWYRNKFNIPVIAITGSVGKTTTKDVVASVLSEKYNVHKTMGNFNSYTGVPLTVFELNNSYNISVMELGTDHFGEIEETSKIVRPSTVCFTNIGISHIETFKTRENILEAKCEVFNHAKLDATVILNADNDILQNFLKKKENEIKYSKLNLKWYGKENKELSEVYAENIDIDFNRLTVKFDAKVLGETYAFEIPGVSEHLVYASLVAILVGLEYNMTIMEIRKGLMNYIPTKMRMNILKLREDFFVIDDTYNASPDSMNSLIDVIEHITDKKRMVILGDMFELGSENESSHSNIGERLASDNIDYVLLVGKNMKIAYNSFKKINKKKFIKYFETRDDLEKYLFSFLNKVKIKNILKNVVVGVKASRGMGLEKIVKIICNIK